MFEISGVFNPLPPSQDTMIAYNLFDSQLFCKLKLSSEDRDLNFSTLIGLLILRFHLISQ